MRECVGVGCGQVSVSECGRSRVAHRDVRPAGEAGRVRRVQRVAQHVEQAQQADENEGRQAHRGVPGDDAREVQVLVAVAAAVVV